MRETIDKLFEVQSTLCDVKKIESKYINSNEVQNNNRRDYLSQISDLKDNLYKT